MLERLSDQNWMGHRCIKRKGITIKGNITPKRYVEIYQGQYQRCCFTGMRMKLPSEELLAMSPDRIDNVFSYDDGNVQFALLRLNLAKNKHNDRAYRRHIAVLYKSPHLAEHDN